MKEALARAAADKAVGYLEGEGFLVLDRDWRRDDEVLSILAEERGTFAVVELRVSTGTRHSGPLGVIDPGRQRMLRSLAGRWLADHQLRYSRARIDVIGLLQGEGALTVEHVRAVG
jgi:putative endonuclease